MTTIDAGRTGRFDLGRVMERTFTVIGKNFATFIVSAVVLVGLPTALTVIARDGTQLPQTNAGWGLLGIGWLLSLIGSYLLQAAIVYVTINFLNNRPVTIRVALQVAVVNLLPILGLAIVIFICTGIGVVLLIVPGFIIAVLWCVAVPARVAERRSIFGSLQRSRDLTRGFRWPVFGLFVIYFIVSMVIGGIAGGVGLATGGTFDSPGSSAVNLIFTALVSIVQGIIGSAGIAAVYYELRTAKEGVGADELAAIFD